MKEVIQRNYEKVKADIIRLIEDEKARLISEKPEISKYFQN